MARKDFEIFAKSGYNAHVSHHDQQSCQAHLSPSDHLLQDFVVSRKRDDHLKNSPDNDLRARRGCQRAVVPETKPQKSKLVRLLDNNLP